MRLIWINIKEISLASFFSIAWHGTKDTEDTKRNGNKQNISKAERDEQD